MVMIGAKLGRGSRSGLYHHRGGLPPSADRPAIDEGLTPARVQKCMREGAEGEWRGSRAAVPMAPRVRHGVAKGAAREWKGRPWD